jgi:deoxycytidine triphosphate deaminase
MKESSDKQLNSDPRFTEVGQKAWYGSVLLRDEIRYYARNHELIDRGSFSEDNLKPASYNLTLGTDCRLGGKPKTLNKDYKYLQIPPYEVAVVSTQEKLKLPPYLIGRWNIRVTHAYEGLLWVGGPQVDPGYEGHLYAPIYNLSNRTVILEWHKPFATIDFVRTTPFTKDSGPKFKRTREDTLAAHDIHQLSSGPLEAWRAVAKIEKRMDTLQTIVFSLIALIFTALAIISGMPELIRSGIEGFVQVPILMVIVAAAAVFVSGWVLGRNAR